MVKIQYAPLVKQLNLAPDQRDAFNKLLTDSETNSQAMAKVNVPNTPERERLRRRAKEYAGPDAFLLGDSGYAQFQEFQSTLPDRVLFEQMTVKFRRQSADHDQEQRCFRLMINERKNSALAMTRTRGTGSSRGQTAPPKWNKPFKSRTRSTNGSINKPPTFFLPASFNPLPIPKPIFSV